VTYEEAKKRRASAGFCADGYGGILCYKFNWDVGRAFCREEEWKIKDVFTSYEVSGTLARAVEELS